MKKWLLILGAAICGLLVLVVVTLVLSLNSVVKAAVQNVVPKITGTTVKLEDVDISLFSGKGTLKGLVIGNPEGFHTDHAFALGTVRVDVDVPSLLSDTIVIQEVYVEGPEVIYEAGLTASNIGTILDNVEKFSGPPEEGKEKAPPPKGEEKRIQINHFLFKDGRVSLSAKILRGQELSVPLPDVELRGIGGGGGRPIGEVAREIIVPLTRQIVDAAEAALADSKALVEDTKQKAKTAAGEFKETTKETVDRVKDLFK